MAEAFRNSYLPSVHLLNLMVTDVTLVPGVQPFSHPWIWFTFGHPNFMGDAKKSRHTYICVSCAWVLNTYICIHVLTHTCMYTHTHRAFCLVYLISSSVSEFPTLIFVISALQWHLVCPSRVTIECPLSLLSYRSSSCWRLAAGLHLGGGTHSGCGGSRPCYGKELPGRLREWLSAD